jgi:hypothetical protein
MPISDLTKDFGDGLRLIALSEALTKSRLTAKYMKTPKTRVHFIENIHLALVHLSKASAVKVASYGTEGMISFATCFFGLDQPESIELQKQ